METLKRYVSGRHTPVEIRWHLAALAVGYWGLVFCAWWGYPAENHYSITRNMLSALGSFDDRHNPQWYWVFSIAMVYCGITMMPVMLYIRRRFQAVSSWGARVGAFFFLVGCAGIVLTGLFPYAHGKAIGNWEWRHLHIDATALITVGFTIGIFWHGFFLLKDKFTKKAFAREGKGLQPLGQRSRSEGKGSPPLGQRFRSEEKSPYLRLMGPYLVCVPVFAAIGYRIRWQTALAAIQNAATVSRRETVAALSSAFNGLQRFPFLEHLAIWALTIFVIWFTIVLPYEPDREEQ